MAESTAQVFSAVLAKSVFGLSGRFSSAFSAFFGARRFVRINNCGFVKIAKML